MRVLQVIDTLEIGGAERVFIDISNLLYEKKVNIFILTFVDGGELKSLLHKEIPHVKFKRTHKFNIYNAYQLSKILKKYDILHVHMRHVYRYIKFICLLFNVKSKIILHDHSSNFKKMPLFLYTFLKPSYYIGVSEDLTSWATQKLKVKQVFKLSNIIIKQPIAFNKEEKEGIVMVGNIKPNKNQLFAIQLAAFLNKKLTIIGAIQDTAYYEILRKEIASLKYDNNITFLHNIQNIQKLLPKFELGIMPSKFESGPLVLIEFLAQNLPFVAYKTGEVSQLLRHDLPHFFVDTFEFSDWQQRISKITNEKYSFEEIFDKLFSQEQYIHQCLSIYQKVKNS